MEQLIQLSLALSFLYLLVQSRWPELFAVLILAALAWIVETISAILADRSLA